MPTMEDRRYVRERDYSETKKKRPPVAHITVPVKAVSVIDKTKKKIKEIVQGARSFDEMIEKLAIAINDKSI